MINKPVVNSKILPISFKQVYNHNNHHFKSTSNLKAQPLIPYIPTSGSVTDRQTITENNRQISETIRNTKMSKQRTNRPSQLERLCEPSENSTQVDKLRVSIVSRMPKNSTQSLTDFIQDSLLNRLTRDKVRLDQQFERSLVQKGQADISHINDSLKQRKPTALMPSIAKMSAIGSDKQNYLASRSHLQSTSKHQDSDTIQINSFSHDKVGSPQSFSSTANGQFFNMKSASCKYHLSDLKSLPNLDEISLLETDLFTYLQNFLPENPGGRVQTKRLQEWFQTNCNDLQIGTRGFSTLRVVTKEFIRQLTLECAERGHLLSQIWESCLKFMQNNEEQFLLSKEEHEIQAIEEFNRIHALYKNQQIQDENEIKDLKLQVRLGQQKHAHQIQDLKDTENMLAKTRIQLQDYKKVSFLLKRKTDQLREELDRVTKRDKRKIAQLQQRLSNEPSAQSSPRAQPLKRASEVKESFLNERGNLFFNQKEEQGQSSDRSLKQKANKADEDEDDEDDEMNQSAQNILGDLLDDRNIVEINNMVMNMDKIVKVGDFTHQVGPDLLQTYMQDTSTQTTITTVDTSFNGIFSSQQRLWHTVESENVKAKVQQSLKIIDDRLNKYPNNSISINNLIEAHFFEKPSSTVDLSICAQDQDDVLEDKRTENQITQRSQPSQQFIPVPIQKAGQQKSFVLLGDEESYRQKRIQTPSKNENHNRLLSPRSPTNAQHKSTEIDKVKTLVSMMKQQEMQLLLLESQLDSTKQEETQHKQIITELNSANHELCLEIERLKDQMSRMRQVEIAETTIRVNTNESSEIKPQVKRTQQPRQVNQAKLMMFKGPHLGQKITLTYDFQKTIAGTQIVEKIKAKQVQKIKSFMPIKLLLKQITLLYQVLLPNKVQDRIIQQKEIQQIKDQGMASFVFGYFLSQFGFQKIAEQKFLILVLSVKHHKQIIRVNVFAKFMGLFESGINYTNDEMKKYIEALEFVTMQSQLGTSIPDNDSEMRYYIPYIRAVQYIGQFSDTRMTQEEKDDLRKEMELMKENDPKNINKSGVIDFDQFMITLFVKYRILVSRAKEYVINAFAACDLDGNGMCNFEEWYLLLRHIEPDRLTHEQVSEIFFANADLFVEGEQNFSFEKFAVVCVEHGLFSDESQNTFLQIKGTKYEILIQFNRVFQAWQEQRKVIEQRIDRITFLDANKLDHWREIIQTLEGKLEEVHSKIESPGIDKKMKPLLIAYLLLLNESLLLEELQDHSEDEQIEETENN